MASKRVNSTAIKGNASKRARSSKYEIQMNQQLAEKEKSKRKNEPSSSINSETATDANYFEGSECNTNVMICNISDQELNSHQAEVNEEQSKSLISEEQEEANQILDSHELYNHTTNDFSNNSSNVSNSHSEQEQHADENNKSHEKYLNDNDVGSSILNSCMENSVNSNNVVANKNNEIMYPVEAMTSKEITRAELLLDKTKFETSNQLDCDLEQKETTLTNTETTSNSMSSTGLVNLRRDDDDQSNQYMENFIIMQLQQRKDSETWYPSKFESGINALTKLFTADDDIEMQENIENTNQTNERTEKKTIDDNNLDTQNSSATDMQKPSDTNNNDTVIDQSNALEAESRNQISSSDHIEIFDDRSDTFETNIDDIMNDSEIWSVDNSPRLDFCLEGVNDISFDNEEEEYVEEEYEDEENDEEEYVEDEYAEEEYETGSVATEDLTEEGSDDSDNESQDSEPERLTKIKSKVVEMYRVDVKSEETPDRPVYENLTVERTLHSIENAAKLRKLRKILENNSIPRPLERGASKFNMVLGEIPDIIEVLKAYPDSSHHAHVRFINPEQENCQSPVGDVYIRNEPRKILSDCSICLLTFCGYPVSTLCGHVFCENCLEKTLKYHKQCPTCRKQLRSPYYHKIFI
ncbi:GATA zinc finger domain-containing protein 14-like [Zerene cesonia]|uniref:GATA zinc finger domain-containing protein 14-like n=1 Tax=Zerene cesonia TaxID=33412 RepID=UPI0018E5A542|nr:GATA zinc finger domain-containing protein 14-like [Zerene cesonia]